MSIDHGSEPQEERCSIVRTRTSLWVELDRKAGFSNDIEALNGAIVGVHIANLNLRTVLVGNRR